MFVPAAAAILCCSAIFLMAVAQIASAADDPGFTRLPGSSIVAQVPDGWECSTGGSAGVGEEQTSVMECLPRQGGVPVTLQRMIGIGKPSSLQTYLRQSQTAYNKASPGMFYMAPYSLEIAGKQAVEVVTVGEATAFLSASADSSGLFKAPSGSFKTVSDSIVFEDRGAFYECNLQTTPGQYTEDLRNIHHAFCDSLKFDAN
jgi:hypothetical protein